MRFIEDDLNQVQGKLGDNAAVVSSDKEAMSTRSIGDDSDATVAKQSVTPHPNGKKRKVQVVEDPFACIHVGTNKMLFQGNAWFDPSRG